MSWHKSPLEPAHVAILTGEQGPKTWAELARGRLPAKLPLLRQALQGWMQAQHRVLICHVLAPIDFLKGRLAHLTPPDARH